MTFLTAAPAGNQLIWSGGICASLQKTINLKFLSALIPGCTQRELALPVDFLYVIVHAHRQTIASFRPAGFKDLASVRSLHARAESMNAQAAANLGLISAFWHISSYLNQYSIARHT
jgi:hypothetical protein